ncbi:probable N-acetyltransferase camello [Carcharodon carcharias]|uniref:probable N-acetyltransferase camello n=1 Tax=Carcharodon carcharias TaxID=13397 RepID=UPI001B7E1CD4|nr:probable N-acetyltransferase camello [Carcharodon carcharias]XP_041031964.1 probable N-acetyltransferase camello [Carcharodon carcharias]XP_041031965.1 probable N-acetyltransferase camello [Carcharodon carcharias]XP_041031966.1 probable N-acetyltransferase camello [Carcharodon carcharias]
MDRGPAGGQSSAATPGLVIRPYLPEDSVQARRIFEAGMLELVPAAFRRASRSPANLGLLLAVSGAVYALTASPALAGLSALALLALVLLACREAYAGYVRETLRGDLADIEGRYLGGNQGGFWVAQAEGAGCLAGTVGAKPDPGDPTSCQLMRLSVDRRYRHHGLGSRLTQTVLDFARTSGYHRCSLQTSDVQEPALRLYQRLGFRLVSSNRPPSAGLLIHLSNIRVCTLEKRL